MSDTTRSPLPREVADAYVDALVALDPVTGTYLGVKESSSKLPDTSPAGQEALAELARATLARLDEAERRPGADSDIERRCARLLRERLTAELAVYEADEGLRTVSNLHSPVHSVRDVFTITPTATDEDWAAIVERLRAVPTALAGTASPSPWVSSASCTPDRARPRPSSSSSPSGPTRTAGAAAGSRSSPPRGPSRCARSSTTRPVRRPRPSWSCGTGCATSTHRRSRARRTRSAASATPAGRATSTARIWTSTRRTHTAGPSTTGSWAR